MSSEQTRRQLLPPRTEPLRDVFKLVGHRAMLPLHAMAFRTASARAFKNYLRDALRKYVLLHTPLIMELAMQRQLQELFVCFAVSSRGAADIYNRSVAQGTLIPSTEPTRDQPEAKAEAKHISAHAVLPEPNLNLRSGSRLVLQSPAAASASPSAPHGHACPHPPAPGATLPPGTGHKARTGCRS
jgi:hypothetical protein